MALPLLLGLGLLAAGAPAAAAERAKNEGDKDRRRQAEIDDLEFRRTQRARMLDQQRQEDQDKASLRSAAQPVSAVQSEIPGPTMDGQSLGTQTRVMGRLAESPEDANAQLAQANSRPATLRRMADELQRQGNIEQAETYRKVAETAQKEGLMSFVEMNFARAPSKEDIAAGNVYFDLEGVEQFNSMGDMRIPQGARGKAKLRKLPNGQEVVDYDVVDASGNKVNERFSARGLQAVIGYTLAQRDQLERADYKDGIQAERQRRLDDSQITLREAQAARAEASALAAQARAARGGGGSRAPAPPAQPSPPDMMAGFDEKTVAAIVKDDVTAAVQAARDAGKPMTPEETADLYNRTVSAYRNRHIQDNARAAVTRDLEAALRSGDEAAYAAAYGEVLRMFGGDPERIKALNPRFYTPRAFQSPEPTAAPQKPQPSAKPSPRMQPQSAAPMDQMKVASDATLRQIASIRGHVNQQAALAELQRRASERAAQQPTPSTAAESTGYSAP